MERKEFSDKGFKIDYSQEKELGKLAERAKEYGFEPEWGVLEVPETKRAYLLLTLKLKMRGDHYMTNNFLDPEELRGYLTGIFDVCNMESDCNFEFFKNPLKAKKGA